jgi:hypothetical protein
MATTTETRTWATIKAGVYVRPDNWGYGSVLVADQTGLGAFRLPSNSYPDLAYPCNVQVTGRTVQRRDGQYMVRVRITFVGDCEPDVVTGGWTLVQW